MLLLCCVVLTCAGCSRADERKESPAKAMNLVLYRDPICYGMLPLVEQARLGKTEQRYDIAMTTDLDAIVAAIREGEADVALLPATTAAELRAKGADVCAVMGVSPLNMSILTDDDDVSDLTDLVGHTIYLSGRGTTAEYDLRILLNAAGVKQDVRMEFKGTDAEALAAAQVDEQGACALSEPYVSSARALPESQRIAVNGDAAWAALVEGCPVPMHGVLVARRDYLDSHPSAVGVLASDLDMSMEQVKEDSGGMVELLYQDGFVDSRGIAERMLASLDLSHVRGAKLRQALSPYYQLIFEQNADSVGGSLPGEDFYYDEDA
jgi:NitT/TauT family transport system substrate-binding protein